MGKQEYPHEGFIFIYYIIQNISQIRNRTLLHARHALT
jgi:hypothetical protein